MCKEFIEFRINSNHNCFFTLKKRIDYRIVHILNPTFNESRYILFGMTLCVKIHIQTYFIENHHDLLVDHLKKIFIIVYYNWTSPQCIRYILTHFTRLVVHRKLRTECVLIYNVSFNTRREHQLKNTHRLIPLVFESIRTYQLCYTFQLEMIPHICENKNNRRILFQRISTSIHAICPIQKSKQTELSIHIRKRTR